MSVRLVEPDSMWTALGAHVASTVVSRNALASTRARAQTGLARTRMTLLCQVPRLISCDICRQNSSYSSSADKRRAELEGVMYAPLVG